MKRFLSFRWTLLALALVAMVGGAYVVFGTVYAKGGYRSGHGHRNLAPLSEAEAKQAGAIYAKTCAGCHGERLEGATGPSLVGVGARLKIGKIEKIAQEGKARKKPVSMPSGLASPEEAMLLAHWLAKNPTT